MNMQPDERRSQKKQQSQHQRIDEQYRRFAANKDLQRAKFTKPLGV